MMSAEVRNPWLDISEADYVAHMSSAAVNQRPVLNQVFREVLDDVRPAHVLVAGCSTGNGLEHVDATVTARVTAVDVNLSFLERVRERFGSAGFDLDVRCADLTHAPLETAAYDLVHAALVLEYLPWEIVLPRLVLAVRQGGTLSIVVQRPSPSAPAVTPTAVTSLRSLASVFRFVDPPALTALAARLGMTVVRHRTVPLPGDKAFDVLQLSRVSERRL